MANLNFQQQPRSVANQSLATSRGGVAAAFNSSSLSAGHVTPTAANLFPGVAAAAAAAGISSTFATQPLSPIRNSLHGGGGGGLSGGSRAGGLGIGATGAFSTSSISGTTLGGSSGTSGTAIPGPRPFPSTPTDKRGGGPTLSGLANATNSPSANSAAAAAAMAAGLNSFALPVRQYGSQVGTGGSSGVNVNNFHSVFGSVTGDNTGTPPLLDLSEFPSLTNRGQNESMPQPNPMSGKQAYVGMVKQPTTEVSEFQMSNEDFPALPGTQSHSSSSSDKSLTGSGGGGGGGGGDGSIDVCGNAFANLHDTHGLLTSRIVGAEKSANARRGVQTSPDGKITHIPPSMVRDQFGMVGLLQFIRAAESDPNLMQLALGQDLTTLGLNLNVPDTLYPTFAGPWAEHQFQPHEIDLVNGPNEYFIYPGIKEKLASIKLAKYKEDLLFYLFYTFVGDFMQLMAAAELYDRDWRYHVEEKVWISLVDGTYYYFDPTCWRKVVKDFHIDANKLESRPNLHLIQ